MGQKILVVDDDADILEIISYILTDSGYEVATLKSGERLFSYVQEFEPALVLMDIMLGSMDGRLLCKQLKENPATRSLPVILISASHNISESLLQDGAPDGFISKPFDIFSFVKKVETHLDQSASSKL